MPAGQNRGPAIAGSASAAVTRLAEGPMDHLNANRNDGLSNVLREINEWSAVYYLSDPPQRLGRHRR